MDKRRWTNEEIAERRKSQGGFGYSNREDTRIFVPKSYGFGFTFNWGNPLSYVVIASIIAAAVCAKVLFGVGN